MDQSGCKRKVLCPASSRGMEGNVLLAARLGEITVYADLKIRHQRRLVLSLPVAYFIAVLSVLKSRLANCLDIYPATGKRNTNFLWITGLWPKSNGCNW